MALERDGILPGEDGRGEEAPSGQQVGRVASPQGREATSEAFTFWVPEGTLVEKTQLVYVDSIYGARSFRTYGLIEEVFRQSRRRSVAEERDRFDGRLNVQLPLESHGITFAQARILGSSPALLTPPREESPVWLAGEAEAMRAYGVPSMGRPLVVGRLKNGGEAFAGKAFIDLDYLLGANGGHLNVNGIAGAATKSSFLLFVLYSLLDYCRRQDGERPLAADRLRVVPIVLNTKGLDLFWLDHENRRRPAGAIEDWTAVGLVGEPFRNAELFAPQRKGSDLPVVADRPGITPYSWSLADAIENGIFSYLFADEDREDENFAGLLQHVELHLTAEQGHGEGMITRSLRDNAPRTFADLLGWVDQQTALPDGQRQVRGHATGTWQKLRRRFRRILQEGAGILREHDLQGRPLRLTANETRPPAVVDIQSLHDQSLQRFVVATIFRQVLEARTSPDAVPHLVYVIVLDELNRFAPKGATDAVTRLVERVVSEMRSQGIILFGAQQQASLVSPKVIENCSIRVLGRTGSLELSQPLWSFLSPSAKRRAESLGPDEKLVYQVNFREPMHVRVPFPAWAMRRDEAGIEAAV